MEGIRELKKTNKPSRKNITIYIVARTFLSFPLIDEWEGRMGGVGEVAFSILIAFSKDIKIKTKTIL